MTVSGKTRVCGIIAYPVEHSMSPLIQNYLAEKTGADLIYVPFKTRPENLAEALKGLFALNVAGVNVTVPHKQAVIPFLCGIDDTAASIGAVNTLVRTGEGYVGYNTDAEGFLMALEGYDVGIEGKNCILIGAGGAARAAAFILAREGAKKITCLNRTLSRAEGLMTDIEGHFPKVEVKALPLDKWDEIEESDNLAVQTTNVGMTPDIDASPIEDKRFFEKLTFAMDVIYTPSQTRFLELAKSAHVPCGNGLDMLLYQGLAAFRLWNPGIELQEGAFEEVKEQLIRYLEEDA